MDGEAIMIILALTMIGLGCGIAIYLANRFLPEEDKMLARTEEVAQFLPGMNCGACGKPGCFAYAGEVANDTDILKAYPCNVLNNDKEGMKALGDALGIDLSGSEKKVAILHCGGNSDHLFEYEGVTTCKGAAQLSAGFKKCPFGCVGLGDCSVVCPADAISIDEDKGIAIIDPKKCIGCGLCTRECPHQLIEIVPAAMPQYLACNYLSKLNIPGRDRCSIGCIHCRMCVRASEEGEVTWDDGKDLPVFDPEKLQPAPAAIAKCPKKIIFERGISSSDVGTGIPIPEPGAECCTDPNAGK